MIVNPDRYVIIFKSKKPQYYVFENALQVYHGKSPVNAATYSFFN